ncbi:MAG TPA: cupin domain-containing protein [Anaerolineae bacterium]|nr:cupin domain-containing protein [Anaerolineae bacterium]
MANTTLRKVNIHEQAAQLAEPFTMIDLIEIDDLTLSVFLCQGSLPFHRHLDQDELFLVASGTITVEGEWGTVLLRPGEMTVVPKGVGHRSSSLLRSLVLLLQPRLVVHRRNGDRHLFALKGRGQLAKVDLEAVGRQIAVPFQPVSVADVDTFAVHLLACEGIGPWWVYDNQSSLVLCHDGAVTLETEDDRLSLRRDDVTVVPPHVPFRLSSTGRAIVLSLKRHVQPGPSPVA